MGVYQQEVLGQIKKKKYMSFKPRLARFGETARQKKIPKKLSIP